MSVSKSARQLLEHLMNLGPQVAREHYDEGLAQLMELGYVEQVQGYILLKDLGLVFMLAERDYKLGPRPPKGDDIIGSTHWLEGPGQVFTCAEWNGKGWYLPGKPDLIPPRELKDWKYDSRAYRLGRVSISND